jgi:hypothetical protein
MGPGGRARRRLRSRCRRRRLAGRGLECQPRAGVVRGSGVGAARLRRRTGGASRAPRRAGLGTSRAKRPLRRPLPARRAVEPRRVAVGARGPCAHVQRPAAGAGAARASGGARRGHTREPRRAPGGVDPLARRRRSERGGRRFGRNPGRRAAGQLVRLPLSRRRAGDLLVPLAPAFGGRGRARAVRSSRRVAARARRRRRHRRARTHHPGARVARRERSRRAAAR